MSRTALFLALALIALAGTRAKAQDLPPYLVGIGGQYDRYADPPAGLLTSFAVRVGSTRIYSWTTIATPIVARAPGTPLPAALRTGAAYVPVQSGPCFVYLLGDAGLAVGDGSATLGAFSTGGGVACRLGKSALFLGPALRAVKVNTATVQPVAEFLVFKSF